MIDKMNELDVCYGTKGSILWNVCDIELQDSVHKVIDNEVYSKIYMMREDVNSLLYVGQIEIDYGRDI